MNVVESLRGIIRHTSRTQSPTEKLVVEQLIHNDSADDYDDEWVENLSSKLKVGWLSRAGWAIWRHEQSIHNDSADDYDDKCGESFI